MSGRSVYAGNGLVGFPDAHRRRNVLPSVSAHEILNLALFFDVCAHING
ncbi:hypothetical protein [Nonomuraea sp. SYSU D8015]|nr:hypothetical protein [Nonomuraea sp. SYSU D8015]